MKVVNFIKYLALIAPAFLIGCNSLPLENKGEQPPLSVTSDAYAKPEFKAVAIDPAESVTEPVFKAYSADVSGPTFVAEVDAPKYIIRAQSSLKNLVEEWSQFENYTPYFLTDRQIVFKNLKDLELPATTLAEALEMLFTQLSLSAQGFHYQIYEGSKTLRVYSKK